MVTTSPGWFLPDAILLREAAHEGVPTAATVGWDNPTSKGYRGAEPDLTVAWSDVMARQLVDHHDLDPRRIAVGGVPQFDPYVRPGALPSREDLFRALGLDPERRLILFACRSPSTYAHNLEVASVLANAIERGALDAPAQVVVRPHPINFRSNHRKPMTAYLELAREREHLVIDVPFVSSELMPCDVPDDDYRRLGGLMAHCDVLVNAFSTTTLEGFLLGRPVVLVSDEAHRSEDTAEDPRDGRPFHLDTHMENVVKRDAARVARSLRAIPECVNPTCETPNWTPRPATPWSPSSAVPQTGWLAAAWATCCFGPSDWRPGRSTGTGARRSRADAHAQGGLPDPMMKQMDYWIHETARDGSAPNFPTDS